MRLLNLTIHNVGVFRGRHEFDFSPLTKPDGGRRHLTIITGQNGVGKSTVFQSLSLALHGPLAIGSRVSRQGYGEYLATRLHRYNGTGLSVSEEEGGVKLGFQYTQSGLPLRIQVERRWRAHSRIANESIRVLRNNVPPEIDPADYQAWINELVPPGLGPVCFFDAEQLDSLANPERQKELLGQTLRGLLGLDLVEQLRADLERYALQKSGGSRGLAPLRKDVQKCQSDLKKIDAKLTRLQLKYDSRMATETQVESELAEAERILAAKGGAYAARRPVLEARLKAVLEESDEIEEALRAQTGELLPFSLAPELCRRLSERIARETQSRHRQAAYDLWRERLSDLRKILKGEDVWKGLGVSAQNRKTLAERLLKEFRVLEGKDELGGLFIHHLADTEKEKIQEWIVQALNTVPERIRSLADKLRALQSEQRHIESDLQRAPEEEVLIPIHAEISRLREEAVTARREGDTIKEQVGAAQYQREEANRRLQQAKEKLIKAQGFKQQLALAERSKVTLSAYQRDLTRERLLELEKSLVENFNQICRKEHLLDRVSISADDFTVKLQSESGGDLNLAEFSAGERELYALALISSLRQISGRRLPVIIDTPLARLDEAHRHRFINDYVPNVSDQVVLIVTDTELEGHLLAEAEPYIARIYRLSYDREKKESFVTMSEATSSLTSSAALIGINAESVHVS